MDRQVLAQLTQLYMTVKLECPFYGVNTHRFYWRYMKCFLSDAEVVTVCVMASVQGPILLPKYRVKSFLMPGGSLETLVDVQLYHLVRAGLVSLLGARTYFASKVLTPYCYTLGS